MTGSPCAWVVVLGDLGRSPRMLRHAESFSRSGFPVHLVGLTGRELPSAVERDPNIEVHRVASRESLRKLGSSGAAVRQIVLAVVVSLRLVFLPRPRLVVVQNPPAILILLVLVVLSRIGRWSLWVDWHNTTRSMIELTRGPGLLSRLAGALEVMLSRRATSNLAVSKALGEHLARRGIRARVLYDFPEGHDLPGRSEEPGWRPVTLVAPMSWTKDDDLELLFDAIHDAETETILEHGPGVRIIITGDGPGREGFEKEVARSKWRGVSVSTAWVAADEYVEFLATADAGLSLHRSSSGLDLPIKWIDVTRAGIPLVALVYEPAAAEMLDRLPSCRRFRDARELAAILVELSRMSRDQLEAWRKRATADLAALPSWQSEWEAAFGEQLVTGGGR